MEVFIQQLINSLNAGSIYALIAIGYTMVYGIIRLINFAHGEIMMFGAYFAFTFSTLTFIELPFWAIVLLTMLFAALMGMLIEKIAYKPLRNAPRISTLITAIGISLFLQNLALLIFGSRPKIMPKLISSEPIIILGTSIPRITVVTVLLSVIFMVTLTLFIKRTKPGKAMRAVSLDKEASTLMGINVNGIITLTFAIGSALGGLGGLLYSIAYVQVFPTLGVFPGLKAFVAAVLGGIGSIPGAMLGGYLIGFIEIMTQSYISTAWSDAIVFGILILVLLFKPTGILGKETKEKV